MRAYGGHVSPAQKIAVNRPYVHKVHESFDEYPEFFALFVQYRLRQHILELYSDCSSLRSVQANGF